MSEVRFGFPGVFRGGISFPGGEITTSARSPSMSKDLLDFVFFFGVDQVRRWRREVGAVSRGFFVGG